MERGVNKSGGTRTRQSGKRTGSEGERRAAEYLAARGFAVLARNFRTKTGEIDIIARKGDTLVFVEVKALPSGNRETLARELDCRKQKRIVETAKRFLANHRQYSNDYIRFDVIVIDMPDFPPVYHIENAFAELL